jgi:ribosome biogenesis protein Tsr3
MDWVNSYRFKTLEELEQYKESFGNFQCGHNDFTPKMYKFCGLSLRNFDCIIKFEEKDFKEMNQICIIDGDWNITREMVVNIIEDRKRKLNGLV